MLAELKIENIGIIEDVNLRLQNGLHVITGETGAGKSLLLSALDAVLGSRVTVGMVRNGAMRGNIKAVFTLPRHLVKDFLPEKSEAGETTGSDEIAEKSENAEDQAKGDAADANQELCTLTLQREISANGRSRMYINGKLNTTARVRELALQLIEIHGQHEHQRLLDPDSHLDFLDAFAHCEELRAQVTHLYNQYRTLRNRIRVATLEKAEREQRLDFIRFALDEIEEAQPQLNEYENLKQELSMIRNSGTLFQDLQNCYGMMRADQSSIMELLQQVIDTMEGYKHILPSVKEGNESLKEAYFILETAADWLREKKEGLDFSPERLQVVEERMHQYHVLFKKYGSCSKEILEKRDRYLADLAWMETSDDEILQANQEIESVKEKLVELAKELSRIRRGAVFSLEKELSKEMRDLGMGEAQIRIMITRALTNPVAVTAQEEDAEPTEKRLSECSVESIYEKGYDRVEFFLAANQGEPLCPLRKVVSGGELSRISLILKTVLSERKNEGAFESCMVFDEVDAGVGGEIAHRIATRLKRLAERHQVIVVTHLHQIACVGDHHFMVKKETLNGRTYTQMAYLNEEARLIEMSRILGDGSSPNSAARSHARELLGVR